MERGSGRVKRGADRHYPLLRSHDIIQVVYQSGCWNPDDNCHLWMWVTDNFLNDGLFVMKAFGFRYVRMAIWPKSKYGLGQYLRGQHEACLFGVMGRLPSLSRSESSLFGGGVPIPSKKHSKKPLESYEKIERVSPGPRIEMFSRAKRDGWWSWGNEI